MIKGKMFETVIWLCLIGIVISACGTGGEVVTPVKTEVVIDEEGNEMIVTVAPPVLTEEIQATEEVPVPTEDVNATASATDRPVDTPTPEVLNITRLFEDALNDCLLSDGSTIDCSGYDIDAVLWALAQNGDDLSIINMEAKEAGFVPLETPITISYPFLFVGIKINNIDPDAAYYCVYWTHQQPTTLPSDPTGNVLSTCYNHRHDFRYANLFGSSGQPQVEADPASAQIFFDPSIGVTFGQELGSIFVPASEGWVDALGFTHEGSQWDKVRFEPDL